MSAPISIAPTPAAAQVAKSTSGISDAESNHADGVTDAGTASFGSLFQQMLAKPAVLEGETIDLILPVDGVTGGEANTTGSLAALMPFLEGMGLVDAGKLKPGNKEEDDTTDADAENPLAGIAFNAPGLNTPNPAISATASTALENTLPAIESQEPKFLATNLTSGAEKSSTQGVPLTNEFTTHLAAAQEIIQDKGNAPLVTSYPMANPTPPTSAPPAPSFAVEHRVGAQGWDQEVGNRMVWMANKSESRAELVLTPPQMGRVEVSLSVTGDHASATFVSANPAVREALEAALPRLRELFADAGIQLGQTQVGAENPHQAMQQEKNGDNFGSAHRASFDNGEVSLHTNAMPASSGLKIGRGLVDVFA